MNKLVIFLFLVVFIFTQNPIGNCVSLDKCRCTRIFETVCGSNNETYTNPCFLQCAQTTLDCAGACPCNEETLLNGCEVTGCCGHEDESQIPSYCQGLSCDKCSDNESDISIIDAI